MNMSIRFPNLELNFEYVPKAIRIFGFQITFFGILLTLGMLLGIVFVVLEARRRKQDTNLYMGMIISGLLGSFVGARLFYVIFSWSMYKSDITKIFDTRSGGMVFYGGLLGGILAAAVFCHVKKASFMEMADIASMGLLIGQIIGRWGNFFNRESFGEYTSNILTMQLPLANVRASEVTPWMRENLANIDGVSYIQVTPTFLYESIWCFVLFIILLAWSHKKLFSGEIFMRYLAGYGFGRFFIEWIRTDKILWPGTDVAVCQVISAALFVFFSMVVVVKRIMAKKRAALRKHRRERIYEEEREKEERKDLSEQEEEPVSLDEADSEGTQEEEDLRENTADSFEDAETDTHQSGSAEESKDKPET